MKSITDAGDIRGKRVLVRVDWSVPMQNGKVMNDYQIRKSFPTIEYLRKAGAKIILISHGEKDDESLESIYEHVKSFLPLTFIEPSDLVLLENVRQNKGEKENTEEFARQLADQADIYVNEAFSVSHREHASIVGVPKFLESYCGFLFQEEVDNLSKAFYPKKPFLFILAGAKFGTKMPLIEKFIDIADNVFVGGALANNFFKEMNMEVGDSLVAEGDFHLKEKMASNKIILPSDVLVKRSGRSHIVSDKGVEPGDVIVDSGPNTLLELKEVIGSSASILWNGPLGNYEEGYKKYTLDLAQAIADSGKMSILGGGDTLAAINELGLLDKFTFVSTGGGAMLDFLAKGTLPGIEAIKN